LFVNLRGTIEKATGKVEDKAAAVLAEGLAAVAVVPTVVALVDETILGVETADLQMAVSSATHRAVLLHREAVDLSTVHQNRYRKQSRLRTTSQTLYRRARLLLTLLLLSSQAVTIYAKC
jgi:hypothetical protein